MRPVLFGRNRFIWNRFTNFSIGYYPNRTIPKKTLKCRWWLEKITFWQLLSLGLFDSNYFNLFADTAFRYRLQAIFTLYL